MHEKQATDYTDSHRSLMIRVWHTASLVLLICIVSIQCKQPETPTKPLLYLPDDLEATLWAQSPLFYNPTNMDVDIKGRIWITEAVNYRNFNNDSAKFFHHKLGDRVMIL